MSTWRFRLHGGVARVKSGEQRYDGSMPQTEECRKRIGDELEEWGDDRLERETLFG